MVAFLGSKEVVSSSVQGIAHASRLHFWCRLVALGCLSRRFRLRLRALPAVRPSGGRACLASGLVAFALGLRFRPACLPCRLRSAACGLRKKVRHAFGGLISPPLAACPSCGFRLPFAACFLRPFPCLVAAFRALSVYQYGRRQDRRNFGRSRLPFQYGRRRRLFRSARLPACL